MSQQSIVLVGCPDSGKSNYVGRLWAALQAGKGLLQRAGMPNDITYVETLCEHLLQGAFVARTDRNQARQDFCVPLRTEGAEPTELIVPDFTGEIWQDAVKKSELSVDWQEAIENAHGAMLFVRVHSNLNVQPLDWVTARDLLTNVGNGEQETEIPTQVVLCELLELMQARLARRPDGSAPRLSVVVSAWDRLDATRRSQGPMEYLIREFPLFGGALSDVDNLDIKIYGVSIVGGDLSDESFRLDFQTKALADCGWVVHERDGGWHQEPDVTAPVAWAIGGALS
ncbi:hypothetical protein SAMN05444679_103120 [Variovorax sp. CF079]|uniref:TRAFAC clade GTPase domain-containing protein n=1 Tax=Variovorax sp. CF079 TaxID=1882774 RepID=UPI00088E1668|nr:hypothetical protein [Variovorax sp. CF079]SDC45828.1 hypothetical protein SAMN05444679_103120 [Variovorax sp. CF079]